MTNEIQDNIQEMNPPEISDNGARFWAYVKAETIKKIPFWAVLLEQENGTWSDVITSNDPYYSPQTPKLSGVFKVTVIAGGPNMKYKKLLPKSGSKPNIGCNENCAAMVGIVCNQDGSDAEYWTVWDALCK